MELFIEQINVLAERLAAIEVTLNRLAKQTPIKDWYTTHEVAELLGKAEFTVREWCRCGRMRGVKRRSGRGRYKSWAISHEELRRIEREGLLPVAKSL